MLYAALYTVYDNEAMFTQFEKKLTSFIEEARVWIMNRAIRAAAVTSRITDSNKRPIVVSDYFSGRERIPEGLTKQSSKNPVKFPHITCSEF